MMVIKNIKAREILDSRGVPTIECSLLLSDGHCVSASVPSGASTGIHEARELRDGDDTHYFGQGVLLAIENIENKITPLITNKKPDVILMDQVMIALDGTSNKSYLGANAMLAVSMAVTRAQAYSQGIELYQFMNILSGTKRMKVPQCLFNIINGGAHAESNLSIQEIMIAPENRSAKDQVETAATIYHALRHVLQAHDYDTDSGDEGGFAPLFKGSEHIVAEQHAFDCLTEAIEKVKQDNIFLALDVAASQFYNQKQNTYVFDHRTISSDQLICLYEQFSKNYPIKLIEDGCAQDDFEGWRKLKQKLGGKVMLVGDDLFVTNASRIEKCHELAGAVIIKPNQIGTVSEALDAIKCGRQFGLKIVVSHRSGETGDTFISDLAFGVAADYFKAGAPARGERVCKYNRLMEIEMALGFPG